MKFGVVVFPGSNCDRDVIHVCRNVLQKETRTLWHKDTTVQDLDPRFDCIILPGGFSYGDYLRILPMKEGLFLGYVMASKSYAKVVYCLERFCAMKRNSLFVRINTSQQSTMMLHSLNIHH